MYFSRCAIVQNVEIKILAKMPHLIHKKYLSEKTMNYGRWRSQQGLQISRLRDDPAWVISGIYTTWNNTNVEIFLAAEEGRINFIGQKFYLLIIFFLLRLYGAVFLTIDKCYEVIPKCWQWLHSWSNSPLSTPKTLISKEIH